MKIILLFAVLSLNLFSLEIKDRTSTSVRIEYDKIKGSEFNLFESKNGKDFDNNSKIVEIKNGELSKLKAETYYKLSYNGKEISFWTLAEEPKNVKTNISFKKAQAKGIKLLTSYMDIADGGILIATLGIKIDLPVDGRTYPVGSFGDESCRIGSSYVVGYFNPKKDINLNNLKYGIYKFALIPFNGKGETINYYTDKPKIRETHPQLPIPVQKECEYFKENVAEIKWEKVEGAKYYEITVCEDKNCNSIMLEYNSANVSNGLDWKLFLDDEQKKYYWKIKAVGLYNSSEYNELMEIDYYYINSAKK